MVLKLPAQRLEKSYGDYKCDTTLWECFVVLTSSPLASCFSWRERKRASDNIRQCIFQKFRVVENVEADKNLFK